MVLALSDPQLQEIIEFLTPNQSKNYFYYIFEYYVFENYQFSKANLSDNIKVLTNYL
jgi:hypothetical protein